LNVEWHTIRRDGEIYEELQRIRRRYQGLRTFGAVVGEPIKLAGNYRVLVLQKSGRTVKIEGPGHIISRVNTLLEQVFRGKDEHELLDALPH
jgi:hypothetical protein